MKKAAQTKALIYARVSTAVQSTGRQIGELAELAKANSWQIVETIEENISGSTAAENRAGMQRVFELATAGKIDKVLISEISRLGRNVADGVQIIQKLTAAGVSIYVQNIGMETLLPGGKENFMFKPILLTLLGFSEMEKELLKERVKSGLEKAKKDGKRLGRPKGTTKSAKDILTSYPTVTRRLKSGMSVRETAKLAGVAPGTVQKVKKALQEL